MKLKENRFFPDLETAKLKLALLKENFAYRKFFEKLKKDPYEVCPELRKPNESEEDYLARLGSLKMNDGPRFGGVADMFGINEEFLIHVREYGPTEPKRSDALFKRMSLEEALDLLDPDMDWSRQSDLAKENVANLFYSRGIRHVVLADRLEKFEDGVTRPGFRQLQPQERLLLIDLRKRRSQLLLEFEKFLRFELINRKATVEEGNLDFDGYNLWEPESDRERKEAERQLKIWKRRKFRKSFSEIADKLGITEDLAKKSFYRAYELTQRRPYDPERYRKEGKTIREHELPKSCKTCTDKKCLEKLETGGEWDPCPGILAHVNQDHVKLREKTLGEGSDSYRDSLLADRPKPFDF